MYKVLVSLIFIFSVLKLSAQEGYIKSADSKIYYRTFGKGKPLLIINGGPGMNSNGFVNLAQQLSIQYQTIIYDQRGTGKSSLEKINSTTISMDLMVSDLERLRKQLKIDKWIILGHSFGGMLASYYATIHPETIEKLILSSSGGIDLELLSGRSNPVEARLSETEKTQLAYWNKKISEGDTTYNIRLQRGMNLAPAYVYDRKNIPVVAKRLTEGNSRINSLVWADLQRIKFNCAEKLKSFNKPVLIIQGKQDIVTASMAVKANKVFKNSRVIFINDCVHYGWLDNPAAYFAAINQFLNS